jgi:serine/threonine protein kinase
MNTSEIHRFGRYEVRSKLGAGGMGEVWLARDTQLDRAVALKVLAPAFASDIERKQRFIREARAVSALNHPNILTVYEIGEEEATLYMATEFIDGETLRQRMQQGGMPALQTLEICEQVAGALDAAHEAGIVHRDVKPENIMLRRDGYAKVLDFGLAKTTGPISAWKEAATLEQFKTTPGLVIGTVQYMSPEQARGLTIDVRTDIWSLGVVLYELTAGRVPFGGPTPSDIIAAILERPLPSLNQFTADAHPELQRILATALQKNPDDRYQTMREFGTELKHLRRDLEFATEQIRRSGDDAANNPYATRIYAASVSGNEADSQRMYDLANTTIAENFSAQLLSGNSGQRSSGQVMQPATRKRSSAALWLIPTLTVALLAGGLVWWRNRAVGVSSLEQLQFTRLTSTGRAWFPVISPDGKYVVYLSAESEGQAMIVRQVQTGSEVQIMPPSSVRFAGMTFSNDGNYVYYVQSEEGETRNSLYQLPTLGGVPKKILEDIDSSVSFAPDGQRFVFERRNKREARDLLIIANADGTNEQIIADSGKTDFDFLRNPVWSPDGERIALTGGKNQNGVMGNASIIELLLTENNKLRSHSPEAMRQWTEIGPVRWMPDGDGMLLTAVAQRGGNSQVWYMRCSTGAVQRVTNDQNDYDSVYATADANTLVVMQRDSFSGIQAVAPASAMNESAARPVSQISSGSRETEGESLAVAPDGRIVFTLLRNGATNLWMMNADGSGRRQMTSDNGISTQPAISRDGRSIIYSSNRGGSFDIWRMGIDGSNPQQLTNTPDEAESSPQWSPDGQFIVYEKRTKNSLVVSLWKLPIPRGAAEPIVSSNDNASRTNIRFSPDGKTLAYIEDMGTGRPLAVIAAADGTQILRRFEFPSSRFVWSPDGQFLTYTDLHEGTRSFWNQPVDGASARIIADVAVENVPDFAWSEEERRIIYSRMTATRDVVVIKGLRNEN